MDAQPPLCLTISGSDSSGGAGLQTDLAVFRALGCAGASVVTCVTAQSHCELRGVSAMSAACVEEQLECVLGQMPVVALKTGALVCRDIIDAVCTVVSRHVRLPLVLDPVLLSSSGKPLLDSEGERAMMERLIPLATVVTPNIPEAAHFAGVAGGSDAVALAHQLQDLWEVPVLVKGGHSGAAGGAIQDVFDDGEPMLIESPRLENGNVRGTGCALASAIAARLAHGDELRAAVRTARGHMQQWIASARQVGTARVLGL